MPDYLIYPTIFIPKSRRFVFDMLSCAGHIQAETAEDAIKIALETNFEYINLCKTGIYVYVAQVGTDVDNEMRCYYVPDKAALIEKNLVQFIRLRVLWGDGSFDTIEDTDWDDAFVVEVKEFNETTFKDAASTLLVQALPDTLFAEVVWVRNEQTGQIVKMQCAPLVSQFVFKETE